MSLCGAGSGAAEAADRCRGGTALPGGHAGLLHLHPQPRSAPRALAHLLSPKQGYPGKLANAAQPWLLCYSITVLHQVRSALGKKLMKLLDQACWTPDNGRLFCSNFNFGAIHQSLRTQRACARDID